VDSSNQRVVKGNELDIDSLRCFDHCSICQYLQNGSKQSPIFSLVFLDLLYRKYSLLPPLKKKPKTLLEEYIPWWCTYTAMILSRKWYCLRSDWFHLSAICHSQPNVWLVFSCSWISSSKWWTLRCFQPYCLDLSTLDRSYTALSLSYPATDSICWLSICRREYYSWGHFGWWNYWIRSCSVFCQSLQGNIPSFESCFRLRRHAVSWNT